MILFFLLVFAIGRPLQDLKIGIVNKENINCSKLLSGNVEYDCKTEGLSCYFIASIPDHKGHKIFYETTTTASNDSKKGVIEGYVYIPSNFSIEFLEIQSVFDFIKSENSHISVYIDRSNYHKSEFTKGMIAKAFEDFIDQMMPKCNRQPELFKSNLIFRSYKDDTAKLDLEAERSTLPAGLLL